MLGLLFWLQLIYEWGAANSPWRLDGATLRRNSAIASPRAYTLLLNGANPQDFPYRPDEPQATGWGDSATTSCIDLSADTLAYVVFAYQRGGWLDPPEPNDTLSLWAKSAGNTWERLWYATGRAMADSQFQRVIVPLRGSDWLHACFQLRWKVWGSTWGAYDNWLIAYTYVLKDTAYTPTAWERLPRSYHATLTSWMLPRASSDSLSASFVGGEGERIRAVLYVNQQPFWHTTAEVRQGRAEIKVPSLSSFSPGIYSLEWRLERATPPETLYVILSDTLRLLPNVLAYDDGEVERGYGVRQAGKPFLQEFELDTAWQITAIGIKYFVIPTQVGKPFQLGIWQSLQDRQPLYLKYERVFPDSIEGWRWYRIDTPVVVRGRIGVGLIQADGQPLGVGWDAGCPARLYVEQGGTWSPSAQSGCLHIRLRLAAPQTSLKNPQVGSIFSVPSPVAGGTELPKDKPWAYPLRLWNAQGQLIAQWGAEDRLQLPYLSGLYYLQDSLGRSIPIFILP